MVSGFGKRIIVITQKCCLTTRIAANVERPGMGCGSATGDENDEYLLKPLAKYSSPGASFGGACILDLL